MNLIPLDNYVVIKPSEHEERSPGGIIVPTTAREKERYGVASVVATGPGKLDAGTRVQMQVRAGHTVLYNQFAGVEVEREKVKYRIVKETDIYAVEA